MNYIFNVYFVNVARKLNIDKYSDVDTPDFNSIYAIQLIIHYFSH